ncbi:hypothetical protein, partial [Pseudomonas aeruginosa]
MNIATGNKYQSETDYAGPAIAPLPRIHVRWRLAC